jgi:hypothetical protein
MNVESGNDRLSCPKDAIPNAILYLTYIIIDKNKTAQNLPADMLSNVRAQNNVRQLSGNIISKWQLQPTTTATVHVFIAP